MLEIEHIDGHDIGADFDNYMLRSASSLLYTSQKYIDLISGHINAKSHWLVARENNNIVGLLPYATKDGPLGPVFNSLPYYGSNGGVIQTATNLKAKSALIERFYACAEGEKACSATVITNPLLGDSDFYDQHAAPTFKDERIGQITHLPDPSTKDDLMSRFSNPRPRNIRRAIKEGVEVDARQDDEALQFLFDVHTENMKAIGGLAKNWSFFEDVKNKMSREDWQVYVASLNGEPISALLLFYYNRTVEYYTPVTVGRFRNSQPLALIVYRAMLDAIEKGYSNWNWGGTWTTQDGVYDFKKRWDTVDHNYYYYVRLFNRAVLNETPASLLAHYPGFYVVPFSELENSGE